MTKKDYEKMAAFIASQVEYYLALGAVPIVEAAYCRVFGSIVSGMADLYASDNPRFNREKFVQACLNEVRK
jgi:hypothetical protein